MQTWRDNPESEENQKATRENKAEVKRLQSKRITTLHVFVYVECKTCNGSGKIIPFSMSWNEPAPVMCPKCGGKGFQ